MGGFTCAALATSNRAGSCSDEDILLTTLLNESSPNLMVDMRQQAKQQTVTAGIREDRPEGGTNLLLDTLVSVFETPDQFLAEYRYLGINCRMSQCIGKSSPGKHQPPMFFVWVAGMCMWLVQIVSASSQSVQGHVLICPSCCNCGLMETRSCGHYCCSQCR
jgi:hypothetical protein